MAELDFRALHQFIIVVEEGSMRSAAARLDLTQPALTKAVRRLEDELGVQLLERSASGVRPTVFGEAFLRHARALRATCVEATSEMRQLRAGKAGQVRLGAGPSWHGKLLPAAVGLFRESHPDVALVIRQGMDSVLKPLLREGKLDFVLAAIPETAHDADLDSIALIHDDYVIYAEPTHPLAGREEVALADLVDWPWILPPAGTLMRERMTACFRAQGLTMPEPAIETDNMELRVTLMSGGPFLTCNAGRHLADELGRPLTLLPVSADLGSRAAGVVTRKGIEPHAAAASFIEAVVEIAAQRDASVAERELPRTPA
jgi:DNA-binding transcriptional LysR family regulator